VITTFSHPLVRRGGFTLAEMLIAIVIFSAVVSMTYGAYNATFKVIEGADAGSEFADRARVTLDRFSEDLHSFYLGEKGMLIGESSVYGDNRGDQLSFTSRAHLVLNKKEPVRGLTRIIYRVEEQSDTGLLRLYRVDVPVLPGAAISDEEDGFLLCDGLRQVAFTYIDEDGNEYENWSTEEKKQQGEGGRLLPVLVRMNIGFGDEEAEDARIHYSSAVALPADRERR